jgi:ferritin-like metal-binding protein YciE
METKTATKNQPALQDEETSASQLGSKNNTAKKNNSSLRLIFEELLNDTYNAEKQLVKALPELAQAAYNEDLQEAFETHLEETKKQVTRLDRVYERLRINKQEEKCKAMEGLIEEAKKIIQKHDESPLRDSALIIAAQKVEHYEIAAYGSLLELADVLSYHQVYDLIERTLQEEEDTDSLLTEIAMDVNDEAYETGLGEEKDEEL